MTAMSGYEGPCVWVAGWSIAGYDLALLGEGLVTARLFDTSGHSHIQLQGHGGLAHNTLFWFYYFLLTGERFTFFYYKFITFLLSCDYFCQN